MEQRMIIAGTGGQGVMVTGKILGYAASDHDKFASFLPRYGTQMRGGTSSCTLIVSDEEIGSPIVSVADLLIIFQQSALEKYIDKLKPGGILFLDSDTCYEETARQRKDIEVIGLPVDEEARALGSKQVANIIMLGAYAVRTGMFTTEEIIHTLRHVFENKPAVWEINENAIRKGAELMKARR